MASAKVELRLVYGILVNGDVLITPPAVAGVAYMLRIKERELYTSSTGKRMGRANPFSTEIGNTS